MFRKLFKILLFTNRYKKQVTTLIAKIKENELQIEKMENRINDEDLHNQIEVLRSTNKKLREELIGREKEIETQRTEIVNLQDALAELEEASESHIDSKHKDDASEFKKAMLNSKVEAEMKEYLEKIQILESQLINTEVYKSQVNELCAANQVSNLISLKTLDKTHLTSFLI